MPAGRGGRCRRCKWWDNRDPRVPGRRFGTPELEADEIVGICHFEVPSRQEATSGRGWCSNWEEGPAPPRPDPPDPNPPE